MKRTDQYERKVELKCPICGHEKFDSDETISQIIKCASCKRATTKDDLLRENKQSIDKEVNKITKEVINDLEKDVKKILEKAFK